MPTSSGLYNLTLPIYFPPVNSVGSVNRILTHTPFPFKVKANLPEFPLRQAERIANSRAVEYDISKKILPQPLLFAAEWRGERPCSAKFDRWVCTA